MSQRFTGCPERIVLQDVPIIGSALDVTGLPLDVVRGQIGSLDISLEFDDGPLPAIKIAAQAVCVVARLSKLDDNDHEARAHTAKLLHVQMAELTDSLLASSQAHALLLRELIRRLEFTVQTVDIQFESSQDESSCSLGMRINKIACVNDSLTDSPSIVKTLAFEAVYFHVERKDTSARDLSSDRSWEHSVCDPFSASVLCDICLSDTRDLPTITTRIYLPQLSFGLDDLQCQDIIQSVDAILMRARQLAVNPSAILHRLCPHVNWDAQSRRFRPPPASFKENTANARLRFALDTVLYSVRMQRRMWSWPYLAGRRDDRLMYTRLFRRRLDVELLDSETQELHSLERKLCYADIRLYRRLASSMGGLRRTDAITTAVSALQSHDISLNLQSARNALFSEVTLLTSICIVHGFLSLRMTSFGRRSEILRVIFDSLKVQARRASNIDTDVTITIGALTALNTMDLDAPPLLRCKGPPNHATTFEDGNEKPFFFSQYFWGSGTLKVRILPTEITYDQAYVEALFRFFKVPKERLHPIQTFLALASQTIQAAEEN